MDNRPQIVLPGDQIVHEQTASTLKLGPGLLLLSPPDKLMATRVGLHGQAHSRSSSQQQQWIQGHSKRYVAALGDPVIGIIVGKHADGYRVDIGTAQSASLDGLAFEGATKRNKPNLKIGAVVYARVSLALSYAETEIECINPSNQKSDGFGEMVGGTLIRDLDLTLCKKLLSPPHTLLNKIGAKRKFELSIGMNGRVWCKADSISHTIDIVNQIQGC
ncbi:hypothetical protein O181_048380 [Austropuccinia psidii MF-1]|uniref:Ribosomal RNA-processing protein 40 n=1 Tax=Austropuccinia psidii MF-1 TaxID=1389203 RepID=A0A9Q3DRU8_9BASI|nr:hypothetical protein [Austropuccinia psidii MF-1]